MFRLFFISLLSLLLSACAIKPIADYRSHQDFSQYTDFSFAPLPEEAIQSIDSTRIRDALSATLQQQGFMKADITEANFQVSYHIESETELEQIGLTTGIGFSRGRGGIAISSPSNYYERAYGKIVVELLDPATKSIVWRSVSQQQLRETMSSEQRSEFIRNEIALMLADFPPQAQ